MNIKKILFVLENNYFPRDMRVYNECMTLANSNKYKCYVIAPRQRKTKEKFIDIVDGKVKCFRYPSFDANNIGGLFFEYIIAAFFYVLLIPFVVLLYRINIIHVANPPDFILPLCAWTKLLGVKLIFDQHDLSIESFIIKVNSGKFSLLLSNMLSLLEKLSYQLANIVIATNRSIEKYEKNRCRGVKTCVVRNSNQIQFKYLSYIPKKESAFLRLGYFGILGKESGGENLVYLCDKLHKKSIDFKMIIIGDGPGMGNLKELVHKSNLVDKFFFNGFVDFSSAMSIIVNFDFGILPWINCKKHHMHTATKVMDYMCCGVPVCSLNLKEQLISAGNIGIFSDNFDEMVEEILKIYADKREYEKLRQHTLKYFNKKRAWEIENEKLKKCYRLLD